MINYEEHIGLIKKAAAGHCVTHRQFNFKECLSVAMEAFVIAQSHYDGSAAFSTLFYAVLNREMDKERRRFRQDMVGDEFYGRVPWPDDYLHLPDLSNDPHIGQMKLL